MNEAIAAEIQACPELVHQCSLRIPDFVIPPNIPVIEADLPWHGVVIHDLPRASLLDAFDAAEKFNNIWTLLEREAGVASKDI